VILPDVNVLVYAFRREAERHEDYSGWLAGLLSGPEELAYAEATLTGFLRIVTNPRIMATPAPLMDALRFTDAIRGASGARLLTAQPATWAQLAEWAAADRGLRGNLLPDAWLAALARTHGARLATADRGFARYPGVDWFVPVP
jgi:uncharacterized protein